MAFYVFAYMGRENENRFAILTIYLPFFAIVRNTMMVGVVTITLNRQGEKEITPDFTFEPGVIYQKHLLHG